MLIGTLMGRKGTVVAECWRRWRLPVRLLWLLAGALIALYVAPAAMGADSIYWTTWPGGSKPGLVRVGNLDGSGSPQTLFMGGELQGITVDSAAGKLYWGDVGNHSVNVGNLDGTGAKALFTSETYPTGMAVDPGSGRLYWVDSGIASEIRAGNVDGSSPRTLYSEANTPLGLAIDPAAGKVYWTTSSTGSGAIRVGNLDGSGSAKDLFAAAGIGPSGVAIDQAAGKIYWTDYGSGPGTGSIRVGNLDGSGSPKDLFNAENAPTGIALDPAAGKIYWVDGGSGGSIRVGNLDGSGSPQNLFTGEDSPNYLALLRSPVGTGAPIVSGGQSAGSMLSCSQGSWAADLLGAFLYRAPHSFAFQWSLNGADIAGASSSSYAPTAPGSYSCRVTASNAAGSSSQTSTPFTG